MDLARTSALIAQGYIILRYWNHDILNNIDGVLTDISNHISKSEFPLPEGEG